MGIRVYNTLARQKEDFVADKQPIGIYVCGVTPYAATHLGHARPAVVWDVIKKYLRWRGFDVYHVQNFTDVDDKIIAKAQQEGIAPLDLSAKYSQEYLDSMDALGVERADVYPRVSEHIEDIVDLVAVLVEKGHAYASDGSVFYDVASFPQYGKLSNQRPEELLSGTRFEVDPAKRSPLDFALWKKAKPGEPSWDSPWGPGRPGWHIECSAMSKKYLGDDFEFHGGGSDLVFPHHENEIAQSEAATGKPLARYWLHNGMLNLKAEKMSKSTGNFVTIEDIVGKHPKELFRFYMLVNHYRSELEYHDEKLNETARGWRRLNQCVNSLEALAASGDAATELTEADEALVSAVESARAKFCEAMDDDFNTALATAALFELTKHVNAYIARCSDKPGNQRVLLDTLDLFHELGRDVLGILGERKTADSLVDPLMELLLDLRQTLRKNRDFALADEIRDRLFEMGVAVEDTPQGSRWKVREHDE